MIKAVKYINTLDAHYDIDRKEHTFCFDNDIVEKIIGDMFFDLDAEDEHSSKERAMSIFKKMDTFDDTYTASVWHRDLLSAYRSEDCLYDAITTSTDTLSFSDGWRCVGSGRF